MTWMGQGGIYPAGFSRGVAVYAVAGRAWGKAGVGMPALS